MFTGLIEHMGRVQRVAPTPAGVRLLIDPLAWAHHPALGESIAVNGCCLTVAEPPAHAGGLAFDVVPETLAKTTLASFRPGTPVNLEHAATPSTLLGGHIVQGHVDGVGEVVQIANSKGQRANEEAVGEWRVRVALARDLMAFVVPKGSIAVDGVSLTIASVDPAAGWFEVALIPTTLAKTTLAGLAPGDRVNIECDATAKTIVHYLMHFAQFTLHSPPGSGTTSV